VIGGFPGVYCYGPCVLLKGVGNITDLVILITKPVMNARLLLQLIPCMGATEKGNEKNKQEKKGKKLRSYKI